MLTAKSKPNKNGTASAAKEPMIAANTATDRLMIKNSRMFFDKIKPIHAGQMNKATVMIAPIKVNEIKAAIVAMFISKKS